jgi:hypothetical protein
MVMLLSRLLDPSRSPESPPDLRELRGRWGRKDLTWMLSWEHDAETPLGRARIRLAERAHAVERRHD